MPRSWDFPRDECRCEWQSYHADCPRPYHVALALRDVPQPRLPLIFSAPAPDYIPDWVIEAAS